jgi:hypothetical protein
MGAQRRCRHPGAGRGARDLLQSLTRLATERGAGPPFIAARPRHGCPTLRAFRRVGTRARPPTLVPALSSITPLQFHSLPLIEPHGPCFSQNVLPRTAPLFGSPFRPRFTGLACVSRIFFRYAEPVTSNPLLPRTQGWGNHGFRLNPKVGQSPLKERPSGAKAHLVFGLGRH